MEVQREKEVFTVGQSVNFDATITLELPHEIIQEILAIAFTQSKFEEGRNLLCVSKGLYYYLARFAYRFVQITTAGRLKEFLSWMDGKSTDFLRATVKALHVCFLMWAPKGEKWTALLSRLKGLQMLFIYCSDWFGHERLLAAWQAIFVLPELKSLRLDWHFNASSLTIPPPYVYPCYTLQSVTHLTIVGHSSHSFDFNDIVQFRVLSHLAIVNPTVGYSRDDLLYWARYLVGLRLMVILVFGDEQAFIEGLDKTQKIVGFVGIGVGDASVEFRNHATGSETMWTRAEAALVERRRMRSERLKQRVANRHWYPRI